MTTKNKMGFRKFTEYGAAARNKLTIRTNDLLFISKNKLKQTWLEWEVIDWGTNNEPKKS